ncbi:DUF6115 domain-containing protein [Paenibacillus sp.]|uniref:DUF6115 domain-containing protein n=1 Tax=Paenibacillus sp. TaxID=58172 RepID=UPI0039C9DA2D
MWMIVSLLGLVILLYASLLPRTQERKPAPEEFLDSMGDTLQQFADEIEQENKELLRMVGDMKREHEKRTSSLLSRIEQLEKQAAPPAAAAVDSARSASAGSAFAEAVRPEPAAPAALAQASPPVPAASSAAESAGVPAAGAPAVSAADDEAKAPRSSRFAGTVKARYQELFELYDAGKSIEYIAKKLGKNKGEVQLIIGLAKQEEPQHGQP